MQKVLQKNITLVERNDTMAIEYNQASYSTSKNILAFPDHFVAIPVKFDKAASIAKTTEDGRKIVEAGTVYPANNNTAIGVVMYDCDVTRGDANGAVIIHGFIRKDKMPTPPDNAAIKNLRQITFLPIDNTALNT